MEHTTVKVRVKVLDENYIFTITVVKDEFHPNPVISDEKYLMVYGNRQDEQGNKWHNFPLVNLVTYSTDVS